MELEIFSSSLLKLLPAEGEQFALPVTRSLTERMLTSVLCIGDTHMDLLGFL